MNEKYKMLFSPITIKSTRFRNRIFAAPNSVRMRTATGNTTEAEIAYYQDKARGGAAQVSIGETMVDYDYLREGKGFHLNVHDVNNLPMLNELSRGISIFGAVPSIQLLHPGMYCSPELLPKDKHPISSSSCILDDGTHVDEMTEDQIEKVIQQFADTAAIVKANGFQMLQIHGGHGWLIDQFSSPLFNRRTDRWGGNLENRARFAINILDRVRKAVGDAFLIEYRISGDQMVSGGMNIDDTIEFVKMIEDKIDILHVSAALHNYPDVNQYMFPQTEFTEHGCNVHLAASMKKAGIKVPIETIGGIGSPDLAEKILEEGYADIIGMTRELIAEPELPNKARNNKVEDIVPCLRCSECLIGLQYNRFACQVNPNMGINLTAARERYAGNTHRILVAGGGPAGMEAAIYAARFGHHVTLIEKKDRLGGLLNHSEYDPKKEDLRNFRDYLVHQSEKWVSDIRLNTEITPELVRRLHPDEVIMAVGARPAKPRIEGIDGPNVFDAFSAYQNAGSFSGKDIVIIGGGLAGCELAILLARNGCSVKLVEMSNHIGDPVNWRHTLPMMKVIKGMKNLECRLQSTVVRVNKDFAVIKNLSTAEETNVKCDTVVYSTGLRPRTDLLEEIERIPGVLNVISIGDCSKPGKIMNAVQSGYYAALNIGYMVGEG